MYSQQEKMSTVRHVITVSGGNIYVSEGEIPETNPMEYSDFRASTFGVGTTRSEQGQTNICDCDNPSIMKIFSASLALKRFGNRFR